VYTCGNGDPTVREEGYERLRAMKRDDESFSDLLLRLTGAEHDVMAGVGALTDEAFAETVDEAREELDEGFEDRSDAISGQ
jgi:predicted CopG family antitoxin